MEKIANARRDSHEAQKKYFMILFYIFSYVYVTNCQVGRWLPKKISSTSAVIKWLKMLKPLVFPYMTRFL